MIKKIYFLIFIILVFLIVAVFYSGIGRDFFPTLLKWGEIVIVFSFLAGLFKLIRHEIIKITEKKGRAAYSIIIVISFILTMSAGLLNFETGRAVLNNSIKEHPEYFAEIVKILINEDRYLKKYPAKKKLVLIVAGKSSQLFVPTEEMLKNADILMNDYNSLRYDKTQLFINEDDSLQVKMLVEKVKKTSLETVKIMLPAAIEMKAWFNHSVSSLPDIVLTSDEIQKSSISDLVLGDSKVEKSGEMLKNAVSEYMERNNLPEIEKGEILVNYRNFVTNSAIGYLISSTYSSQLEESLSKETATKVLHSFLLTETTASPKIKGVLQWIYRRVYDPLFSAFMTLLLFSMIAVAYRRFTIKSYSLAVIAVSSLIVIAGFIPFIWKLIGSQTPSGWQGPFSQGFMMNVFSRSVFSALLIGAGVGIVFYYFSKIGGIFSTDKDKE